MPNHVKPTSQDLEAMNQKLLEDLEKPSEPIPSEPAPSEPAPSQPKPSESIPSEPAPSEPAPSQPVKEATPEEKLKERYRESTREAQRLYRNNVQINQAITDAETLPDPTEEELKVKFPEWEEMSATERLLAKETVINQRFRETIKQAAEKQKQVDEWGVKVNKFIDDPKSLIANPDLEGKVEDFKVFASDKKLVGYEFDILVNAFLHGLSKTKVSHKGEKMFEAGTVGPNDKPTPKSTKLSIEDSAKLMQTNYKQYKEELKAGNIQTE